MKSVPKEASREEGFQRVPKEVMVLKATEPFTYDVIGGKRMFHATVATESQFFQVKIFNAALKEKFIPNKAIAISDYIGRNGFLEVFNVISVSDVKPDRKMEISKSLIQKAKATPKISHLYLQDLGTFVNGVFVVHKVSPHHCFAIFLLQSQNSSLNCQMNIVNFINIGTQSPSDQG